MASLQPAAQVKVQNANTVETNTKNPFPGMAKFVAFTPKKLAPGTGGSLGTPKFSPTTNKIPLPGFNQNSGSLAKLTEAVKGPQNTMIGQLARSKFLKAQTQTGNTNPKCPKCGLPTMLKETDTGPTFICPKDGDISGLGGQTTMEIPGGIQIGQSAQTP